MAFTKADSAILAFCLSAVALLIFMCLYKSRKQEKKPDDRIVRIKVVSDHYSSREPAAPVKEAAALPPPQEEKVVESKAAPPLENEPVPEAAAPVATEERVEVQTAVPKIPEEEEKMVVKKQMKDKVEAKEWIALMVRRWRNRKEFHAALASWKTQERERRQLLKLGKTGSMNLNIDKTMLVKAVSAGGAAETAGVKPGDIIVLIESEGRGGARKRVPMPRRAAFLRAVGPQSEVYEGSVVQMTVIREEAEKKAWNDDAGMTADLTPGTDSFKEAWLERMSRRQCVTVPVTIGKETDGARNSRRKNMERKKLENKLDKLQIDLVDDFLSDPDKCAVFVREVFNKADKDGSGQLEQDEIHNVFTQMSEITGIPAPSHKESARLFSVMDESYDQKVSFEEFFPYFRTKMIKLIMAELLAVKEDEEEA